MMKITPSVILTKKCSISVLLVGAMLFGQQAFACERPTTTNQYDMVGCLSDGLAYVSLNDEWYYIDSTGKTVISGPFSYAGTFSEGLANIEKNGKWGYINTKGKIIIPLQYESYFGWEDSTITKYYGATPFENGIAVVAKGDNKVGIINKEGKVILPLEYESIGDFYGGLATIKKDGKSGAVNTKGTIVIPIIYDDMGAFWSDTATVELNGETFEIDKTGKRIQ